MVEMGFTNDDMVSVSEMGLSEWWSVGFLKELSR
jgi:hypothetical protein